MSKKSDTKIKKPSFKKVKLYAERRRRERQPSAMDYERAVKELPRITNDTVSEHREEILSGARKFIYPLQHTKRRVVMLSLSIIIVIIIGFITYMMLALYSFRATSAFVYRTTQVLPFPVAKTGSDFISYESYLFELRHYMHYYETQQQANFSSEDGQKQLELYRRQALDQVVEFSYVKKLAKKHNISVSNEEVNSAVALLKDQNRLGDDRVLSDVLKDYWGWNIGDFKRELSQQILAQKVARILDVKASDRSNEALKEIRQGIDFSEVAKKYSDDTSSKENGGVYDGNIDEASRDIPPQIIAELKKLNPGQTSGIISTGSTLEIVKLISKEDGGKFKAAHIVFQLSPLTTYIKPLQESSPPSYFIRY